MQIFSTTYPTKLRDQWYSLPGKGFDEEFTLRRESYFTREGN